jgi:hypothetical protein
MGATTLAAADFDGDSRMDLAVGTGCATPVAQARVSIFKGYGDGTFDTTNPIIILPSGSYTYSVIAEDLNGDGKPDIACVNQAGVLQTYKNTSTTSISFSTVVASVTAGPVSQNSNLEIGDFNGDGIFDYIVTGYGYTMVSFIPGGAGLTLGAKSDYTGLGAPWTSCTITNSSVADYNQDGKLDIMINRCGFQLLKGNNAGVFTAASNVLAPPNPYFWQHMIRSFDMNADGIPDLLEGSASNIPNISGSGLNLNNSN